VLKIIKLMTEEEVNTWIAEHQEVRIIKILPHQAGHIHVVYDTYKYKAPRQIQAKRQFFSEQQNNPPPPI